MHIDFYETSVHVYHIIPRPLTSEPLFFNPKAFHVGFVVDETAQGQFFLRVLQFSPVGNMSPLRCIMCYWGYIILPVYSVLK